MLDNNDDSGTAIIGTIVVPFLLSSRDQILSYRFTSEKPQEQE